MINIIEALLISIAAQVIYSQGMSLLKKIPSINIKKNRYLGWKELTVRMRMNRL